MERDFIIPVRTYGMRETMPDITQVETGRRLFHVHREKRAERAIRLMQQGTGPNQGSFSNHEIHRLLQSAVHVKYD